MPSKPKPDEFGRYRVQTDTGAKMSVTREPLPHEKVLSEPASDVGGDALPVEYPGEKQSAESITVPPLGSSDGNQKES